jgi:hypothetical protein
MASVMDELVNEVHVESGASLHQAEEVALIETKQIESSQA